MPELPEVETVRAGIEPWFMSAPIRHIDIRFPTLRYPIPAGFASSLSGKQLKALSRRAKYLIFDFGGFGFLMHLGMSGSLRAIAADEPLRKHDHLVFHISKTRVVYHDPRRFGAVDLWQGDAFAHKWLSALGPEPLGNAFSGPALYDAAHSRKTSIKSVLLDQHIVAGLGNIYVCEALWRAGIDPRAQANTLSRDAADALVLAIQAVLNEAIASGGSTLRDYRQADGELGYFQHKFDVYGREGEDCHREGCSGKIERIAQSGRSSFYCPCCQKQTSRENAKKSIKSRKKR